MTLDKNLICMQNSCNCIMPPQQHHWCFVKCIVTTTCTWTKRSLKEAETETAEIHVDTAQTQGATGNQEGRRRLGVDLTFATYTAQQALCMHCTESMDNTRSHSSLPISRPVDLPVLPTWPTCAGNFGDREGEVLWARWSLAKFILGRKEGVCVECVV